MKIIYPQDGGGIAVIHPVSEYPIEEIALKDVPAGKPYLIVQDADIPPTRADREAWTADFSVPDGIGLGADAYFALKSQQAAEAAAIAAAEAAAAEAAAGGGA